MPMHEFPSTVYVFASSPCFLGSFPPSAVVGCGPSTTFKYDSVLNKWRWFDFWMSLPGFCIHQADQVPVITTDDSGDDCGYRHKPRHRIQILDCRIRPGEISFFCLFVHFVLCSKQPEPESWFSTYNHSLVVKKCRDWTMIDLTEPWWKYRINSTILVEVRSVN